MVAPYVVEMGDLYPRLQYLFMGSTSVAAGAATWALLPETGGAVMPETAQDVLDLFQKKN